MLYSIAGAYLFAALLTLGLWRVLGRIRAALDSYETVVTPPYDDAALRAALDSHAEAIDALQAEVTDQSLAIAEGIRHVDRAERRVRAVVGRAKKRLDDAGFSDAGLDGEVAELREIDGSGSPANGVPTLREGVGAGSQERDMSHFPGRW